MPITGKFYCDFEGCFSEEISYNKNYEKFQLWKLFGFYDEVIVPEPFMKNLKIERTLNE